MVRAWAHSFRFLDNTVDTTTAVESRYMDAAADVSYHEGVVTRINASTLELDGEFQLSLEKQVKENQRKQVKVGGAQYNIRSAEADATPLLNSMFAAVAGARQSSDKYSDIINVGLKTINIASKIGQEIVNNQILRSAAGIAVSFL